MKWDEWRGSLDGRHTMWIKLLFRFRGWRLDLHKIIDRDDFDCYHTHPAKAFRIILWGGYIEELEPKEEEDSYGDLRVWRPGDYGIVEPALCHRIFNVRSGPSYSLWLRWPKTHNIELRGSGWPPPPWTSHDGSAIIVRK